MVWPKSLVSKGACHQAKDQSMITGIHMEKDRTDSSKLPLHANTKQTNTYKKDGRYGGEISLNSGGGKKIKKILEACLRHACTLLSCFSWPRREGTGLSFHPDDR